MASMTLSEAQVELINSLKPEEIPIKLRCATCSKLAVNAFRLPCCEQAICESCQSTLPNSCPICEHSPLEAADCNPHKSLRTTIRVFVRTEEKKRESQKPKETQDVTISAAPLEPAKQATASQEATEGEAQEQEKAAEIQAESSKAAAGDATPAQGQQADEANTSQPDAGAADAEGKPQNPKVDDQVSEDADLAKDTGQQGKDAQQDEEQEVQPPEMNGPYQNMNYQNMGGGDMSQMQMMMAMQNGMGLNPMMGMNMDPMTMQNMYMNGDFQGMGMNNMGNFGGGYGQGSGNDWDGMQSWNFDQNNYNQSGAYGSFHSGFQQGFNQGGYGNHFNDYRQGGYFRGRGRARGYYNRGYGRAGYNSHVGRVNYQQQQQQQQQQQDQGVQSTNQQLSQPGDQVQTPSQPADPNVDEYGRTIVQPDETADAVVSSQQHSGEEQTKTNGSQEAGEGDARDVVQAIPSVPGAIQSVLTAPEFPVNAPTGPKAMRQGLPNTSLHHLRARGYQVGPPDGKSGDSQAGEVYARSREGSLRRDKDKDQVDNSREETGSREGRSRRDRDRGDDDDGADGASRDRGHSRSPSPSSSRTGSRARSRSRSHKNAHRHSRHRREESAGDDDEHEDEDQTDGHRRRRRHRGGRRHRSEDEVASRDDKTKDRSRSASPAESRRSTHKRYKDKEHGKGRDADGGKDYGKGRDADGGKGRDYEEGKDYGKERDHEEDWRRSSHKSHREKDRERDKARDRGKDRGRDRDRDRERDRERDRVRRRDRDRDRERDYDHTRRRDRGKEQEKNERERKDRQQDSQHQHRQSTNSSRKQSVDKPSALVDKQKEKEPVIPTGPRDLGITIKGSGLRNKDRRESTNESKGAAGGTGGPQKDPHAREREARNRERLLKETMRMALAGTKRHRDKRDDGNEPASRRRRSKKGEDG